ncbi:MAG: efflux RND transporter permease subunit [Puniceicoccales bacterium]|jgi:Cu(I)/Ag(I) efflux system membrane protein CusA/SilA|nr:efflux RND transporter permease subunit [Puniceicoccales bacterium]
MASASPPAPSRGSERGAGGWQGAEAAPARPPKNKKDTFAPARRSYVSSLRRTFVLRFTQQPNILLPHKTPMIAALIRWSLNNRFIVLAAFLGICAWGVSALKTTPVDAIPDLSENQVIVYADWAGRSPQEVEDQITYPLSVSLQGLAGVKTVRSSSMFGFSFLTVIFNDDTDTYFARTRVLERLNSLGSLLPENVAARLGPDATGLGWVYQYYLKTDPAAKGYAQDLGSLRTLQDTFVRYELAAVAGVAEVGSVGGFVRQYQVEVSSLKLKQYGVSLGQVLDALSAGNLNVGGKTIEENGAEFVVRGIGLVESPADLEKTPLLARAGTPLYLRDVARVRIGGDFRRGTLDVNGQEAVGGIVVMRYGENAYRVIQDVKARIDAIQKSLPAGVQIEPFYDRSDLISRAIATLKRALTEEIILVVLAHILFLFHFRSIIIVTIPLPAAVLVSFILMKYFGIPSHIMSLTGIAISIGVLVDAGIVMVENVIRHWEEREKEKSVSGGGAAPPSAADAPADAATDSASEVLKVTFIACAQVGRAVFFSMAIILLAFVPVFLLGGQEGKLFHPLAFTKSFALLGAVIIALTVVPVLCSFLVRKAPRHGENKNIVMRFLLRLYDPVLDAALRNPKKVLASAVLLFVATVFIALGLPGGIAADLERRGYPKLARLAGGFGSEFMPALEEGSLLFMPVLMPATSLTEAKRIMAWQDTVLARYPEVALAAGKLGRADTATDPAPVEMLETTITLKPVSQWRPNITKEKIVADLMELMTQVPGYSPGFLQPIENRVLMTSTGIRAQVGVKIFGDDLRALEGKAAEVARIVAATPGATGVAPSRDQGKLYLEIVVDRDAMGRYGLRAADVLRYVETGLGGTTVSTAIHGRERRPIQVRLDSDDRADIEKLGELQIPTPSGPMVPLGQVAQVRRSIGPGTISSENGRLRVYVQTNVRGRDLGGFVADLRERVGRELKLAPGQTLEFSGDYENQLRAQRTLFVAVPMVVAIIFLLLVMVFKSVLEALHVLLAVPFALTGGVILQALLGHNMSVAVAVGYIALFGTAIQTGIVMVLYLREAVEKAERETLGNKLTRAEFLAAVKSGARLRLRPKVMTVATTVASLLPLFWSTQTGVEIMRPIATPVVGGMLSSLLHILLVTPVLFVLIHGRKLAK